MQKNSQRLKTLQGELATGKRINKTSDDPIGATIVQDIVTTISRNDQTVKNIDTNIAWLDRNEIELNHVAELMEQAKVLALSQANDTATLESRAIVAQELRAIREAMFDAANARMGKLFIFSGTQTFTQPLRINHPIQEAKVSLTDVPQKDVAELLDVTQFKAQFEEHSSNEYRVKISRTGAFGHALYQVSDDFGETWSKEHVLLPVIKVFNSDGKPNDEVILRFTNEEGRPEHEVKDAEGASFDSTAEDIVFPEGLEFVYVPNPKIAYDGNTQKKEVLIGNNITAPLNITADELFLGKGEDGVNIFGVLGALEKAMDANDGEAVANRIQQLDTARNQVLQQAATAGNTIRELEKAKAKLEDQVFSKEKRLSDVQDIDLAESMVELNTAELTNRTSLEASGRLIQPTLLEFLR
ncbi:MAG: hypothetical protein HQM14_01115 [SAR324 cluster bacterium]|nr:hypothetical protein [SAR324 cluster bacterium]